MSESADQKAIRKFAEQHGYRVFSARSDTACFDHMYLDAYLLVVTWTADGAPESACLDSDGGKTIIETACADKVGHICWLLMPSAAPQPCCQCG